MANPLIPIDWHPETYAVDKFNKVVWKQGSHAVAMWLADKKESLIPGYTIKLCQREDLAGSRREIAEEAEKRLDDEIDAITEE